MLKHIWGTMDNRRKTRENQREQTGQTNNMETLRKTSFFNQQHWNTIEKQAYLTLYKNIEAKSFTIWNPQNIKCNHFSLDISFICLPVNYHRKLVEILSNYQISLDRIISKTYMEAFFSSEKIDYNEMARKIINGYNLNEVVFTSKKSKKKTFFERFFHFFS